VAAALADGADVVAIDRREVSVGEGVDIVAMDMTDYDAVAATLAGCDALVHLAGIPGPGHLPDHVVHDNNVVASYHALRAAAEVGIEHVVQASSVNALGGRFSATPRYDYFPLDEAHPTYAEDPYSLSKWICEQQADAIARANPGMSIASMRFHGVTESREDAVGWNDRSDDSVVRHLWGYVTYEAAARACLRGIATDLGGHEVFYVVAPRTTTETTSRDLAGTHYPDVPIRGELDGHQGFFDCTKAERMLGWRHDED
jgi:UDP-glucose 4-epimerase